MVFVTVFIFISLFTKEVGHLFKCLGSLFCPFFNRLSFLIDYRVLTYVLQEKSVYLYTYPREGSDIAW